MQMLVCLGQSTKVIDLDELLLCLLEELALLLTQLLTCGLFNRLFLGLRENLNFVCCFRIEASVIRFVYCLINLVCN